MNTKPTLEELLEVQAYFGLPSAALVEKDWHVVQALAAIARADMAPVRVVFGGGTALSRAHKLVKRMSEDIDLKIIAEDQPTRASLRHTRKAMTKALLNAGFVFDPENPAHRRSRNESRYTIYQLPYDPQISGQGALRPEIQIETIVSPVRLPTRELPVASFITEAFKRPAEVANIACVSVTETAAEKFVALTRRTAVELANARGSRDPALVRHIYDLHMIREHYDVKEVAVLVREIIAQDAEEFGNQFPAYRENPIAETHRAIDALVTMPVYAERFAAFLRDMVYGDRADYAACVETLRDIGAHLLVAD